jgi:hypothetical protein
VSLGIIQQNDGLGQGQTTKKKEEEEEAGSTFALLAIRTHS